MKNGNGKSAITKPTAISDAKMVAVLANSNWATMERYAKNASATNKKLAKETAIKTAVPVVNKNMAAAQDVVPEVDIHAEAAFVAKSPEDLDTNTPVFNLSEAKQALNSSEVNLAVLQAEAKIELTEAIQSFKKSQCNRKF